MLFAVKLKGIEERAAIRRATAADRVKKAAEIVASEPDEKWMLWCGLNDESEKLAALIPDATEVKGSDDPEKKEAALLGFAGRDVRILVSKPRIAGFGMNYQGCARMIFVGLGDSYEQYYQAIRRCWRFGQARHVVAHVVLSEGEQPIYDNILRKERDALTSAVSLLNHVRQYEKEEIAEAGHKLDYRPDQIMRLPRWIGEPYASA
jgi:hypothetical protein